MSDIGHSQTIRALQRIKLIHTLVWVFFVGCILAIPISGIFGHFRSAAIASGVVLVECAVLALNRGRCPLTDLAARYTEQRPANFDIYLPLWLARWNKVIFGTVFLASEFLVVALWVHSR